MICGSSASTLFSAAGKCRNCVRYSVSCFSLTYPRNVPSVTANTNIPTNCVVNALVEATPISVPACVKNASLVNRTIALEATLQTASVCLCPSACACFKAASVSAVSPDCEITTTKARGFGTDSRYRYSLAISTCVGIFATDSSQYFAVIPAYELVPHARISTLSISAKTSAASAPNNSAEKRLVCGIVSVIARGCSKISFCIKCRYGPSSTAPPYAATTRTSRSEGIPSRSTIFTPSSVISTTSPSSRNAKRSVLPASASASEARKFSPSPTPTTSGDPCRAPTTVCG